MRVGEEEAPRRALVSRDRSVAVCRGLLFIKELGVAMLANPSVRARYSSDLLLPFYVPAHARAGAPPEERLALEVARALALAWRDGVLGARLDPGAAAALVAAASPRGLRDLSQGLYALDALGLPAPGLHDALARRCAESAAADVLLFDPASQRAPHLTVFDDCACGAHTERGRARCDGCGRRLRARARFDVLLDALVYTYHFERLAIPTDGCYFDVLRHLCAEFAAATAADADGGGGGGGGGGGSHARPGRAEAARVAAARDAHYLFYAVTHIVYTLNGFDQTRLGPRLLPARLRRYLADQLDAAVSDGDPDRAGEALVALRALEGERAAAGESCAERAAELAARARVDAAEAFLLRAQSAADGGWACPGEQLDRFSNFHASLVAVAALREPEYVHAAREAAAAGDAGDGHFARSRSLPSLGAPSQPPQPPLRPWEGCVWTGLRALGERGAAAVLHGWLRPAPPPAADVPRRAAQPAASALATAAAATAARDARREPPAEPCALCRVSHAVAFVAHRRAETAAALAALAPLLATPGGRQPLLAPLSATQRAHVLKLDVDARLSLRARALEQRKAAQAEAHEAAERARAAAVELAADRWRRHAVDLAQPLAVGLRALARAQPPAQPQPPRALGAADDVMRRARSVAECVGEAARGQGRRRGGGVRERSARRHSLAAIDGGATPDVAWAARQHGGGEYGPAQPPPGLTSTEAPMRVR